MRKVKISLVWMLSLLMIAFISCKKDDDNGGNTPQVEDGIYLSGTATGLTGLDLNGILEPGREEGTGYASLLRTGMYEKYMYLVAGEFNVVLVAGTTQTTYGWGTEHGTRTVDGTGDLIVGTIDTGLVVVDGTAFTIANNGFYHIVYDNTTTSAYITEVEHWGLMGDATDLGWSGENVMTEKTMTATSCEWEITNLTMRETGGFKFRYDDGWKSNGDGFIFFTNIGKSDVSNDFMTGGGTFPYPTEGEGAYTVTLTWTLADGFSFTTLRTGDVEPLPEYGDMFIVGAATAYGWDAPGPNANAIMHKTDGGSLFEGIYWKICYLTGGEGFKLSAENWNAPNLGFDGVTTFDAAGVTVTSVDGNMSVAESGMYIVVLSLRDDQVQVSVKVPDVYGIGDAFGGWTAEVAANKYTIDNTAKTLVSPPLTAAGNIRTYTSHAWLGATDGWWHSEFVVNGTTIEYRNDSGSDPTAVAGTVGQVVTFHFDDNTGTIAK